MKWIRYPREKPEQSQRVIAYGRVDDQRDCSYECIYTEGKFTFLYGEDDYEVKWVLYWMPWPLDPI